MIYDSPCIISASRRTDIPRYYARWFENRCKAGFAEFRNAFGGHGRVSMRDEDVLGYLFWTKHAKPFHQQLKRLNDRGLPWVMQYTVTGYAKSVETNIPDLPRVIADFLEIRSLLPAAMCLQWRYDPIIISPHFNFNYHIARFSEIASALVGSTGVVNVSFVEPYLKTVRRMQGTGTRFRQLDEKRHKSIGKSHPDLPRVGSDEDKLLGELQAIAAEYRMQLRSCSNPELDLPVAKCCAPEFFTAYGDLARHEVIQAQPIQATRQGCNCIRTVDIGMDNTCTGGCRYCYVVISDKAARINMKKHDPEAVMLR